MNGSRSCRTALDARRRGATVVTVAVTLVVLVGFAALAVDVGHLYVVRTDLQRAADAAALAGASAFADDSIRQHYDTDPDLYYALAAEEARARATAYAARNATVGATTILEYDDIVVGEYNFDNPSAPLSPGGQANAVQVTPRFAEGSENGPVSNYFASLLGFPQSDVSATATAAFDDGFSGYTPTKPGGLIPFTIYVEEFEDQLINGPDEFSYDEDLDVVQNFLDGTTEIVLFPYKDDEGGDGAGNFGVLNVGTEDQGLPALREQILNGITPEDVEAETGVPELTFVDADGDSTTYEMTGSPGADVGLTDVLESRIGDVVGFFLHSALVDTGSNSIYTIVAIRFGRIMEVHLTGAPDQRRIRIQPVVYTDDGVDTDPDAPGSDGLVGRVVLVR